MRLATWNVNSIKMRLDQLLSWMDSAAIDAIVLQETKTVDEAFPKDAFHEAGFDCAFLGQKTYNGVALITRKQTVRVTGDVIYNIPGYPDEQKRFIAAHLECQDGTRLGFAGGYFPNGTELGSDRYLYKLDWIAALTLWLKSRLDKGEDWILAGDFNIAPTDDDVWDPVAWQNRLLVSKPERHAFQSLLRAGFIDTWSLESHAPHTFSWWDYRQQGFEKNHGLRIDHVLASKALAPLVSNVHVDTSVRALEKPSDHAPVVMDVTTPFTLI